MGARVYIPSIGRFTSEDPDPGSLPNLYTYTLDPINGSDLSGESSCGACGCGVVACFSASEVNAIQSTIAAAQVIEATTTTIEVKGDEIEVRTASKPKSSATPSNSSQPANPPVSQIAAAAATVTVDRTRFTQEKGQSSGTASASVGGESNTTARFFEGAGIGCGGFIIIGGLAILLSAGILTVPSGAEVGMGCAGSGISSGFHYLWTGELNPWESSGDDGEAAYGSVSG